MARRRARTARLIVTTVRRPIVLTVRTIIPAVRARTAIAITQARTATATIRTAAATTAATTAAVITVAVLTDRQAEAIAAAAGVTVAVDIQAVTDDDKLLIT